jgi:hypothetical protein
MVRRISLLAVVGMVMLAAQAEAQRTRPTPSPHTPGERGFIGASVSGLATSSDFDTTVDFTLYREPTSFQTSSEVPPALAFDVSGGVNLWRHLGIAIAVSRHERSGDTAISARLPHPYFLDRLRPLDATATSMSRSETTVDLGALWMKPLSRKLLLTLSGGPSFVSYAQDVVTALVLDELYPYDSVGLSRAITVERDGTAIGGFGSGEVYYTITRQFAVGGGARFSRAADDVETGTDQFVSIKTGGLQVGGGVRFLF